ncbi:MAG TPA: hypothetical protein DDY20_11175 [Desulfobulbaceae bacterium]|nr:hypothetical protein [Desulfobulbaceae bacterium]
MFRGHALSVGIRQQVSARYEWSMSRRLARLVTLILCLSLLVVFAFSQLMHRQINSSVNRLEQLQSERSHFGNENISLLAARANLTSKERVLDRAGQKYRLFMPKKEQVRRL